LTACVSGWQSSAIALYYVRKRRKTKPNRILVVNRIKLNFYEDREHVGNAANITQHHPSARRKSCIWEINLVPSR
jgi:hypothetical protein